MLGHPSPNNNIHVQLAFAHSTKKSFTSGSNDIWLVLCNAQSLFYKLDELRTLVAALRPMFICVTETWLTPDIDNDLLTISDFCIFRNDRRDNVCDSRKGGGTVIYAKSSVSPTCVEVDASMSLHDRPEGIEFNLIQFNSPQVSYLLCVYAPPNLLVETILSFQCYIINVFDHLLCRTPDAEIHVTGDLNRHDFSLLSKHLNIVNIVDVPTFGDATLDKFYCNAYSVNDFTVATAPPLGTATNSHRIVCVFRTQASSTVDVHFQKVFDFRESNLCYFYDSLEKADWSSVMNSNNVNEGVHHFYDIFFDAMSQIPFSLVKFTPKTKPWITPVLLDLIHKRWQAYRKGNFSLYLHFKAKVKREIVKSKKLWASKMSTTCKGMWSVVNDVRGKRYNSSVNQIVSLFSSRFDAVEKLNELFAGYFVKSCSFPVLPTDLSKPVSVCNEALICKLLCNLKTGKAPGSDSIHPLLLRYASKVLSRPISHIFNLSFSYGLVPDIWKLADVCPVPKTTPVKRDSFRPISLLPIVGKLLENVILRMYRSELTACYDSCQFAYRPNSSTVSALICIHDLVLRLLEVSDVIAVRILTFDMTHAFDSVPHHLLLDCISKFEISDCSKFVNWINSYLSGRKQRVKLGETRSSVVNVTSGIPQGSVLGPCLFSLYMSSYKPCRNDVGIVKYADDVTVIVPVHKNDPDDLMSVTSEVEHFKSWCSNNQMIINERKTKVLNINLSRTPIRPVPVFENVSYVKILGLFFNCKLTWSNHMDYVISIVSKRLYILRVLRSLFSHDQLVCVFNSIIRSVLEYASPVFLNPGSGFDRKLLSLCKRAFRIVHGSDARDCDKCSMLEVCDRRKTLSIRLFRKVLCDPNNVLHHLLPPPSHRSERLILPHVKTRRRMNGFVFSSSLLYNSTTD
jgi:hypothetical protein